MEGLQIQFETLFHTYNDAIFRHLYFRLGNRERAKELTQEVFMKTWQHLVAGKPIIYEKAFLYKIAGNLFINEIRTDKQTHSLDMILEDTGFEPSATDAGPLQLSEEAEVLQLLQQLPEAYCQVLVMRYIEGLPVKDIATILDEKETNVSMRIKRALERLREVYQPTE